MTAPDLMQLLEAAIAKRNNERGEGGQAEVARILGVSSSALSQIRKGTYKGNPDNILRRVEEEFGRTMVQCPVLGEISLGECAEHNKRPFAASNHLFVRLWKACQQCDRRKK